MQLVDVLASPQAKPQTLRRLKRLYKQAFPANERKPWQLLLRLARAGKSQLLAALDEQGDFCGLAICHFWDDVCLLDYFAVEEKQRNRGLGAEFLGLLQQRFAGRRLLLEIERPGAPGCNKAICLRRQEFYHRCGLLECGLCAHIYATELLLLWQPLGDNLTPPSFQDYVELYQRLFGDQIVNLLDIYELAL